MFNWLSRRDKEHQYSDRPIPKVPDYRYAPDITGHLQKTLDYMQKNAGASDDFAVRHTRVAGFDAALLYYVTITDTRTVESILHSVQEHVFPKRISPKQLPDHIAHYVLPNANFVFMHNLWETREAMSGGSAILLIDKLSVGIAVGALSVPHRQPDTPLLESSTRGPQIAFVENLEINVGMMRRTFDNDTLTVKKFVVGYRSRTKIAVLFQHDVANPNLVKTVCKRIQAVHVDKLTGSATLEQRIVDNHWTMFPLTRATSRVDNCVKEVGQGKVLVIVDGDPTAFLMPGTILDFFQTMEDDQHNYIEATFVRWLRYIAFILSLYLPALYIAACDFNPELMPQTLSLQIARSREGVPFNATIEVTMMQLAIEVIREATLRMPKVMGQTIGIVGGLVLGQASVEAGLVSNILIVVIALCAISIFVLPSYEFSTVLRLLIWFNILCAAVFGIYGIVLASLLILYHMASLKSFGTDYLTPLSGEHTKDALLDGLIRFPIPMLDKRASHLHDQEETRGADYTDPMVHPMLEKPPKRSFLDRRKQKP